MLQLIRHATLCLELHGQRFLIDPFLGAKDAYPPIQNATPPLPIPMVELPLDTPALQAMIADVDAVIVTHLHQDHWDAAAVALIPKDKLLLTQPESMEKLREQGYTNVRDFHGLDFGLVKLFRTSGQHGTGDIGARMGAVSGIVFKSEDMTIYVTGDTIWCPPVQDAITTYQPGYIIVNAGGAQFLTGDPITMTIADIQSVMKAAPEAYIIAVHMDTVNHCHLTRELLREFIAENELEEKVLVPEDGEEIVL